MSAKAPRDPYRLVIQRFNRYGIRCVVVGMSGINYYAERPAHAFATMDYDIFLDPTIRNVDRAIRCLEGLGFAIGSAEGLLKEADVQAIVKSRRTLVATTPDGLVVELLLEVSGYPFSELARDAVTFNVGGVPVKVGRLDKLLRSKQLAGRSKDRQFLQRYRSLLEEEQG